MEMGPDVSLDILSKVFDLSPRRVQQLARDGAIPKATRGKYPLIGAVRGYIQFLRQGSSGDRYLSARMRKIEADAASAEMDLAEKKCS